MYTVHHYFTVLAGKNQKRYGNESISDSASETWKRAIQLAVNLFDLGFKRGD